MESEQVGTAKAISEELIEKYSVDRDNCQDIFTELLFKSLGLRGQASCKSTALTGHPQAEACATGFLAP